MTEGRFEASVSTRGTFDERIHWTKSTRHPMGCRQDHMERESAPFHDLRANGCFQPEQAGGDGVFVNKQLDGIMTARRAGGGLRTLGASARGRNQGIGGEPILYEHEPMAPVPPLNRDTKPWANSNTKDRGNFSDFEHMAEPMVQSARAAPGAHFRAGGIPNLIGGALPHVPATYKPVASPRGFRLAAGKAPDAILLPLVSVHPPRHTAKTGTPRKAFRRREPFRDGKSVQGTFDRYPSYVSDPQPPFQAQHHKFALFTYAAKSKRTMPKCAPWTAGPQMSAVATR
jgi:hypothetical protein